MRQLIAKTGFTLPPYMMDARVVHLGPKDATGLARSEMILFYNEDMAPMTSMDLIDGDGGPTSKINDKWAPLEKALIKRATKRFGAK